LIGGWIDRWINGSIDGWIDRSIDRLIDGWMDGSPISIGQMID